MRELQNVVKYAAALATGAEVGAEDLPDELDGAPGPGRTLAASPVAAPRAADVRRTLAEVEREHILGVLDACGGSQAQAASVLGIARNTLWRKLGATRRHSTIAAAWGGKRVDLDARVLEGRSP